MSKMTRTTIVLTALLLAPMLAAQTSVRELIPASAPAGARVFVSGRGLGDSAIGVTFANSAAATVVSRNDRTIEVIVPSNAVTGTVRIASGTNVIAEKPFTVTNVPAYKVSTVAGGPRSQNDPLKHPQGAAVVLPDGRIAVADEQHHEIKLVTPAGAVSVLAGAGKQGFDDGTGTAAKFKDPRGIAFDAQRNVLYVSDAGNHAIRQVGLDGKVKTIAGNGKQGSGNGTGSAAQFNDPRGLTVGADGAIYVTDSKNNKIRRVTADGAVTTFAGTGDKGTAITNGALLSATFNTPRAIIADGNDFWVADTKNNAIRRISGGQVTTLVSFPRTGDDDDPAGTGDGDPKILNRPAGIVVDDAGFLIVSDSENDFIRRIDPRSSPVSIVTIAGTGKNGWVDGDGLTAQFKDPLGIAFAGAIYVADEDNDALRVLCPEVRVTGLFVPNGALVAGTEVRVFGTGFVPGTTTVQFGGVAATDVKWISSTTLSVKLPQAITGGSVGVTIKSCAGTVGPISFVVDNTAPAIEIKNGGVALAEGALFKAPVTPVITATDDFDPSPTITATLNGAPFTNGTTVSTDNSYTLIATAEDAAGNRRQETRHFTIDTTPPTVEVLESGAPFVPNTLFNRAVVFDLKVTDRTATTSEAKIDGQLYELKTPFSANGPHQFSAIARDALGNEKPVGPLAFEIDVVGPVLTFTSHTNGQVVTARDVVVKGGSDDAQTVTVNGVNATVDTTAKTFTVALTLLEGENVLTATGTDAATNAGTATLKLVLDSRAPEVAITSPASNACVKSDSVEIKGTINDPNVDKITVTLDGTATQATLDATKRNWTANVALGTDGRKSILIEATDSVGHTSTRQLTLTVDRTDPVIEISESGAPFTSTLVARPVTLFFRANDADANTKLTATLGGAAFASGTEVSEEKSHTLTVTAEDCAGNKKTETRAFTIDLTPPHFLSFNPASGSKVAQIPDTLAGTTDADAVEVRVAGRVGVAVTNGAFTLSGVGFADGVNELTLEAVDRAGNIGRTSYVLGIETTNPLIDVVENGEPLVEGSTFSRPVTPIVRLFEQGVTFTATLDGASFNNDKTVSDTGAHTITATATDTTYGHTTSVTRHFTIDRSAPKVTITSPANNATTDADRVNVNATAEDSVGVAINGIAAAKNADGSWSAANVPLELGENVIVAVGRDAAGNTAHDDVFVTRNIAGPALVLTFPPNPYTTNRPRIDVTGRVLRPNATVTVAVPPASAVSVAPDPAGNFRLAAAELKEGNTTITATATDANGKSTSVTTNVIADFTPPRVRILESGNSFADGAHFGAEAVLTADATDNNAAIPFTFVVDGNTITTLPLTISAAGGHTAVITARDAAGNESRIERTFTVGSTAGGGCRLEGFDPADQSIINAQKVELVGRSGGAAGVKVNGVAAKMSNGSFCATVELPSEGANSVRIVCTDAAGQETGTPVIITLNRITNDPSVTITAPQEDYVSADELITVTGTLGNGATKVDVNGTPATITGGNWSAANVRLREGVNILVARASTPGGRITTASRRVTFAKSAPAIAISSPIPGYISGTALVDVSGTYANVDPSSLAVTGLAGAVQPTPWSDTTGRFIARNVPLASGDNTIIITGRDRIGRLASASVLVKYAAGNPTITISDPIDNHYFGAASGNTFRVSGTYVAGEGAAVDVGGTAATQDGAAKTFSGDVTFSTLAGGLTPVIARVSEPGGAGAFDTIRVFKLSDAPKVLETFPAANAVEVDRGVVVLVSFSNPMDGTSLASAFHLESANGTALSGKSYLDKDVLSFAPATILTPGERYTIRVTTAAKDLAGQSLASEFTSSFTVATTASTAPTLTSTYTRTCAQLVDVAGTTTPSTRVQIDYGTTRFFTNASATGAFSYKVPLTGLPGYHVIRVRGVGADGTLSPFVELKVNLDCTGPKVLSSSYDRNVNKLTVVFSTDVKADTLTTGATGSVKLEMPDSRVAGGTIAVTGANAVITPAEDLTQKTFTLKISTDVTDLQGRKLDFPYNQLFAFGDDTPQPGDGRGFITGEVYDATNGRPLAGAEITIETPAQTVTMTTDSRGRYGERFPEGAHTIRASANGYTTVWRQIIVPAGAGVIPIDIRLTKRGDTKSATSGALALAHGANNAVTRHADLNIPAGAITSGVSVTLTSTGAQSLAGLLPLGWSPLASAEIVSAAASLGASTLTFDVPQSEITAASQTLTAVRYDSSRDEWRVLTPVVNIANNKATFNVDAPGAYALVYPDKRSGLTTPPSPSAGAPLQGVADRCADGTCPALTAKSFPLAPEVVLPTESTVATLNIEGASAQLFPSGTAVQAYIEEELRLADGGRELGFPFATDLLLYRDLAGNTGVAAFNLAPSTRAAEVFLEVGFEHLRILPYPGRLDRGTLVGPEGGRVPGDDKITVDIPAGATPEALRATASSLTDPNTLGPIAGYRIVGGFQLTLQRATAVTAVDADGDGQLDPIDTVELTAPARATFTVDPAQVSSSQLILVELLESTPFGNRVFRLASEMTALDSTRWTTKPIDRNRLPIDGVAREGRYLLLAAEAPIGFAKGVVRLSTGVAAANARVTATGLGVADLTRTTGIFNVPVPATPATGFTLTPRTAALGDGSAVQKSPAPAPNDVVNVGDLLLVAQPPHVASTIPANNAVDVSLTTSVEARLEPGIDPSSVNASTLLVLDTKTGKTITAPVSAIGNTGVLWKLPAGSGLNPGTRYVATLASSVRGISGTPLGETFAWSFTTATTFSNSELHPEKIRITIPDANGAVKITGLALALPENWVAIPVRRVRDFGTPYSAKAAADGTFTINVDHDRVTISDEIDLRVLNNNGALSAIIPLTPFIDPNGRAFVAPANRAVTFTSADGTTVAVPAGAFDVATLIEVKPAPAAVFNVVPNINNELTAAASVTLTFEGRAKVPLELTFPAPGASGQYFLGVLGESIRGPRIMAVDTLSIVNGTLTTARQAPSGSSRTLKPTSGLARNDDPKDYLLRVIEQGSYIATQMKQTAASNGMVYAFMDGITQAIDLFWDTMYSMYCGQRYVEEANGRIAFPVPAGTRFTVTGVQPATALTAFTATYDPIPVGDPGKGVVVPNPDVDLHGPHPVYGAPFRIETVDVPPAGVTLQSVRDVELTLSSTGSLNIQGTGSITAATKVTALNVNNGQHAGPGPLPLTLNAKTGDRIILMMDESNVDPSAPISIVFNESIDVGTASSEQQVSDFLKTVMKFEQLPGGGAAPIDLLGQALLRLDSGRRVTILLPSALAAGEKFRLTLDTKIADQSGNGLKLGQAGVKNSSGTVDPIGPAPAPIELVFETRAPGGNIAQFDIRQGPSAQFGSIRELASFGNLLFVAAVNGGILAYDTSDPAALDNSKNPLPVALAPGSENGNPVTDYWSVQVDHHGRVYGAGLTNYWGVLRTFRVEDFIKARNATTPTCLQTIKNTVCQQIGSTTLSQNIGTTYVAGLGSTLVTADRVEAIPRKVRIVVGDDQPETLTREAFLTGYGNGAPACVNGASSCPNGMQKFNAKIPIATGAKYRIQRITVENVTLGLKWSADARAIDDSPIIPDAQFTNLIAGPYDTLRVTRNRSTYAVVTLFGYGIGVFDLNAVESNDSIQWKGATSESLPREQVALRPDAFDNPSGASATSITSLAYSPESAIMRGPDDSSRVYTLDARKGVVDFVATPPSSIARSGELIFTGGANPRFEALKGAIIVAGNPAPLARFNTAAVYSNPNTKKDYLLMPALDFGLFVAEAGAVPMSANSFADVVWFPEGAHAVRVIDGTNMAIVIDGKGHASLIDCSRLDERVVGGVPTSGIFPSALAALGGTSGYGGYGANDSRILWRSKLPVGMGQLAPIIDPETGYIFGGDFLSQRVHIASALDPKMRIVADVGSPDGELKAITGVVPLGVEPPEDVLKCDLAVSPGCPASLGVFRVEATLPGSITETLTAGLQVAVESEAIPGADTAQTPKPYPVAHLRFKRRDGNVDLRSTADFQLKRVLDLPSMPELRYQRGWNRFATDWVVAISDLRASKDYTWPSSADKEAAGCVSCDRPKYLDSLPNTREIYTAGRFLAVRPEFNAGGAYGFLDEERRMTARVSTVQADLIRPSDGASDVDKLAARNLPITGVALEQLVAANSGEVVRTAVDMSIKGRGLDFGLARYYTSAIAHVGAFGRNFDSPLFARIGQLPNGDLVLYDGTGRRDLFTDGGITPPDGVFVDARRQADGTVVVHYPGNTRLYFDTFGRLTKITDHNATRMDGSDGNTMSFLYGARGELRSVVDPTGRVVEFDYYKTTSGGGFEGCISKVRDFDSREVEYFYDDSARLQRVSGPDPASIASAKPEKTYEWGSAATTPNKQQLYSSGQIKSERDALSRTIWTIEYDPSNLWAGKTLFLGGGMWTFTLTATSMTVVDPNIHQRVWALNGTGRIASLTEGLLYVTQYTYDGDGRLISVTRPMGDSTAYGYGTATASGDRRPMVNVETVTESPRTGSAESASGTTRVTSIVYGAAQLPVTIQTPEGTTSITRDDRGNPAKAVDAAGMTSSFTFNDRGQVTQISDPRTGTSTYSYVTNGVKQGYLSTVTSADGMATFQFDNRGNATSLTTPGAGTRSFTVNKLDQVEKEMGGSSQIETTYDATSNPASEKALAGYDPSTGDPIYSTSTYNINEVGRVVSRTENGLTTSYTYDAAGNLTRINRPGTLPEIYTYDVRDRMITATEDNGTAQFAYDGNGDMTELKNPRAKATSWTRNGFGHPATETDPHGITRAQTVDRAGRPVDVRTVKNTPNGKVLLSWSTREYDAAGRIVKETQKLFPGTLTIPPAGDPTGTTDVVTRTIYDDDAHKVTVIDPRGNSTVAQYDATGRLIRLADAAGNMVETTYAGGHKVEERITEKRPDQSSVISTTRYEYDEQGRLAAVLDVSDPLRTVSTRYRYDERGNRIEETDPDGNVRRFEYDLRGNKIKQIEPAGGVTEYAYDDANRLTLVRDANQHETSYKYDGRGYLIEEKKADGALREFTYDENGNQRTITDPNGSVTTFTYDDADRLIGVSIARAPNVGGAASLTFTLDELGRVIETSTNEGVRTFATFDSLGREVEESLQIGSGPKRTVTRGFDAAGNPVSVRYPSGLQLVQTFDPLNRLATIQEQGVPTPIVSYADVGSRLASRTYGNGIAETWSYDPNRRLQSIEDRLGTTLVRHTAYSWSLGGRKTSITRNDLQKQWSYTRNRDGAITGEEIARTDTTVNPQQLIASWDPDPLLNYRSIKRTVQTPQTSTSAMTSISVNDRNQYRAFGSEALSYDANGNLKQRSGVTLAYDAANRLTKAVLENGTVIDNLYDANGRKVRTVASSSGFTRTTDYVLSGQQVVEEYANDKLAARYVRGRGIDEIARADRSRNADGTIDQVVHALQDELGNVDRITDQSGATLERYEYDGYGRFRVFDANSAEIASSGIGWRWLFQGREFEPSLSTFDFRARTLWPDLGRFGQEDPMGVHDSPNLYQAFGGDWAGITDPTGLEILLGENFGPNPYNRFTGTKVHRFWDRHVASKRALYMGPELVTAFYGMGVNTILRAANKGKAKKYGRKRPDAARVETILDTIGVWELKPLSYDPATGPSGVARNVEATDQLNMYLEGLVDGHPRLGLGTELHPNGAEIIPGEVEDSFGNLYSIEAYLSEGSERGLIYYRLLQKNKKEVPDTVPVVVHAESKEKKNQYAYGYALPQLGPRGQCVARFAMYGAAFGGLTTGALGAMAGAVGGTFVLPGGMTIVGAAGLGTAGAVVGGIAGGIMGLGLGLQYCPW
ncbi:MAG TPA: Ig-like domain-containing protein [Thermoanaerobaculia bacterium]|nr:Ig-like domain-containing protein [Thermoanaerobaculia bacterium]